MIKKRKILKERCFVCGSSQIHYRKFLENWKCERCGATFKTPKEDKEA